MLGSGGLARPPLLTLLYKEIREDSFGEMSFKRQLLRDDNESILNGLEPALGLGLLDIVPPGLN